MKAARQQAIVDLLTNHKSLTTEALALQLNVSKETIRRDLSELQTQGKVLRNHGRAKVIHRELISSGGRLERKYGCYVNPSLISQLKPLEIDLFIFSCEGIDSDGALWDSNATNADFKSILLKRASQSLLLIDKSKFNRSGEARIGHLDDVTHIVSDTQLIEAIQAE